MPIFLGLLTWGVLGMFDKKNTLSAIGLLGAVLTSILSQVPEASGLGQVLAMLTPAVGLSPFAMPIFLGLLTWGVLGMFDKKNTLSAIGLLGAVLTSILSQVPVASGLGQVLAILTPAFGLNPFAMPIFLGLLTWGVLGMFDKKNTLSAIGLLGAVLTSILSQVPVASGLGQVLAILTPAVGLSPFAMPIFLGLLTWGVLGMFDKKNTLSAIGLLGAVLTSILSQVPVASELGQVLAMLTPAVGLSPFAMPIFLGLLTWGVLGNWRQRTAPSPRNNAAADSLA